MNCSWCYGYGHNKLGCPELKKAAAPWILKWEEYSKKEIEQGNTPYLWKFRRNSDSMTYAAQVGLENYIKTKKRSATKKRCNFCGSKDHNKRTCSKLKEIKADITKANAAFRQAMVKSLRATGQGVGSLMSGTVSYWDGNGWRESFGIGVVEKIDWSHFNLFSHNKRGDFYPSHTNYTEPLMIHWSVGHKRSSELAVALPDPTDDRNRFFGGDSYSGGDTIVIEKPSSKVSPPEDWLLSKDKRFEKRLNEYFKLKKSHNLKCFTKQTALRRTIDKWIKYGEQNDSR